MNLGLSLNYIIMSVFKLKNFLKNAEDKEAVDAQSVKILITQAVVL